MRASENAQTVRRLWESFEQRDFAAARECLDREFVAFWPHSGERIAGADNFIDLNAAYPGKWSIVVRRIVAIDDIVVSEISVPADNGRFECASVFQMREGKIWRATEYWVPRDSEQPPAWRQRWTQPNADFPVS